MTQPRILLVDDEPSVRSIVIALLERHGCAITPVQSPSEAFAILAQDPLYDLVLSDLMMPGEDGLSLLLRMASEQPALPVVLFTAVHDLHVAIHAFRRGAVDFLLKPFTANQLVEVVTRGLQHSALRRQHLEYSQNLEEIVAARTGRLRATLLDLERSYDATLEAMGDALDLRDSETEGHSKRVTAYTIELAQALAPAFAIDPTLLRTIARGAFLHDIGKIATPDAILLKPGKLSPDEMLIMREHCRRGYDIVRKIPFLADAAEIVFSHQESFDGSGYPRGLAAEQIPLGARIFALADTLDAITSDRPYREGRSFAEAAAEIARCSGCQFDPAIVEVFLQIPLARWSQLRATLADNSPAAASATLCRPAPPATPAPAMAHSSA